MQKTMQHFVELRYTRAEASERNAEQSLCAAAARSPSTWAPGLEAVCYGKGVSVPHGHVGQSIIKFWSSEQDLLNAWHAAQGDGAEEDTEAVAGRGKGCFGLEADTSLKDVFTAPVVTLSCLWIPQPVDRGAVGSRLAELEAEVRVEEKEKKKKKEARGEATASGWSAFDFEHPILGPSRGLLRVTACAHEADGKAVVRSDEELFKRLGEFSTTYDQRFNFLLSWVGRQR